MGMFREATNEVGALKVLVYGPGGAGKSRTSAEFMSGLAREFAPGRPVAWVDTGEQGADPVISIFEARKVPLLITRTRRPADALEAIDEAQKLGAIGLVFDQITDLHQETLSQWRRGRVEIPVSERDAIRDDMREFHDRVKASRLNTIEIARARDDYQDGVKIGRKVDADSHAAFAPALTIYMERVGIPRGMTDDERARLVPCPRCEAPSGQPCLATGVDPETKTPVISVAKHAHAPRVRAAEDIHHYRRAFVEKDRWGLLDGRAFANPTFADFAPVLDRISPCHTVLDVTPERAPPKPVAAAQASAQRAARRELALTWWDSTLDELQLTGSLTKENKRRKTDLHLEFFRQPHRDFVDRCDPEFVLEVVDKVRARHGLKPRPSDVESLALTDRSPPPAKPLTELREFADSPF